MALKQGTQFNDLLNGSDDNDMFAGLGGNDTLNGGGGIDTAWYSGNMAGYSFANVGGRLVVRDTNAADGQDGTDNLGRIETLQFGNGQLSVRTSDFRINTYITTSQYAPTITALTDGGFVVSWSSFGQDGSGSGVYAQRYNAAGGVVGSEFQVNTYTTSYQNDPAITALADGGFVVSWTSQDQDGDGYGIYAQRYNAAGVAAGSEFRVNTYTTSLQFKPAITALTDGGFVVSWESPDQDGDRWDIYTQRYDSVGQKVGVESRVNTYTTSDQDVPAITGLAGGGFVVSWLSYGQDGYSCDIYAQRYDAAGVATGSEFRVNTYTTDYQQSQTITALTDGGFVVSWTSEDQDGDGYGIFAQRYNAVGVTVGSEFRVNTYTTSGQYAPTITALTDGGFVVSWTSEDQDGSGQGIYAQRYDAAGQAAGPEFRVSTTTLNSQSYQTITALADGGFVVSWQAANQDGSDYGIYAQRYDATGDPVVVGLTLTGTAGADIINLDPGQTLTVDGAGGNDILNGSSGDDILLGGEGNDRLTGNAGNDSLDGGLGNDSMIGGQGDDTYFVDSASDKLNEAAGAGNDSVFAWISWKLAANFENLTITRNAINATGNAVGNQLTGNNVNNILDGGAGADIMAGGYGNDTYVVDNTLDSVSENADSGTELVKSSVTFNLGNNIENLLLTGSAAINGYGNNLDNLMTGNNGVNTLKGEAGKDTLSGLAGNDILYGGIGDDSLTGGTGNDWLFGGVGADTLTGGTGADTFRFDTAFSDENADLVTDFVHGLDKISILPSLVGHIGGPGVLDASEFIATAGHVATDAHHILYDTSTGGLYYNADGEGAGDAVLVATLNGKPKVSASDIVLSAGTSGNDTLDGGDGMDMAWYSGKLAGYNFSNIDGRLVVRDTNAADGRDGTDNLGQIETLQFANGQLNITASELRVNTTTAGGQFYPSVKALADGGFIASWTSDGQDGSEYGICAQRYDMNGQAVGSEFQINTYTTGLQARSAITALTDGGFIASWTSDGQDGSEYGIYAQRYDVNGQAEGVEFRVNTYMTNYQFDSAITALGDGGFIVSWTSFDLDGDHWGIYAQRYNANGLAMGQEFQVNTYIDPVWNSEIIALSDGGFLVSWQNIDQSQNPGDSIYARRFDANSVAVGNEFRVNINMAGLRSDTAMTSLAGGGFVISWTSSSQDGSGSGIYAQRYDVNGQAAGVEFRVNTCTTNDQAYPSITALPDGGFMVSWQSDVQDGDGEGIYAQRYDANGQAVGSEFQVNTHTTSNQESPSITALPDGGFVASWFSNGQDGSEGGIYAQRYDANGDPVGLKLTGSAGADTINLDPGQLLTVDGAGGNDILNGSSSNDVLLGGAGNDKLTGNAGNDSLDGGSGLDTMIGGLGNDTYIVDNVGDVLTEAVGAGTDSVFSSVSRVLAANFENLILTGSDNIKATGNAGSNQLTGNIGNNILDGGAGADTLAGGMGNDTYVVDKLLDVITENADSGTDLVKSSVNFTLGNNLENLTLTGLAAINGYGNDLANSLTGNAGNNLLKGETGNDTLSGVAGNDWLFGGLGTDTLTGGLGADTFRFDSAFSDANADLVMDFVHGVDKISILPTLVANAGVPGVLSASEFIATAGHNATDAHHILYDTATGGLFYNADGAGAGDAVLIATFNGKPALSASDILLSAGTPGNDTLNGGVGMDTAWYSGNMAGYSFANVGGRMVVRDTNAADGQDGTDNLGQIETLQFAGGQLSLIEASSEVQVNTYTTSIQNYPTITAMADGGFVVSWQSNGQDGDGYGIYAQCYNAAGRAVGLEFQVNSSTTNSQIAPTITALTDGGFVVSWSSSNGQDGSGWGVYAQRYNAAGVAAGSEFQVNTFTTSDQYNSSITALVGGGFVVSWDSFAKEGSNFGICAQRYDAAGQAAGAEFQVNTYTTDTQSSSAVTALTGGGFVVSWQSDSQDGSSSGIYAKIYNAAGVAAGAEFRVNTYTNSDQGSPTVTELTDGGFVVTWQSNGQDGSGYSIYAQRYNAAGVAAGAEFRVNTYTNSNQGSPTITALTDGGFVVTWQSNSQDGSGYGIYAQRYNAAGQAAGSEFRVNTYTNSDQGSPTITALTDGGFVVSWASDNEDGDGYGIYAQQYDANGDLAGMKLIGTAGADTINLDPGQLLTVDGAGGNDILNGSSGDDVLLGGTGNDKLTGNAGNDYLAGGNDADIMIGGLGDDVLLGGTGNDSLTGNDGNDWLDGGAGTDTMIGGLGDDTYIVDNVGDILTEAVGAGTDSVVASVSRVLAANFENLTLTGGGNNNATGNTAGNQLTGNSGNNILDGGVGADILAGGMGDDTYIVDNISDSVSENANSGTDLVKTSVAYTLGNNVENLTLAGTANINGYGNALANTIMGNAGSNLLNGGDGNDNLSGLAGNDWLSSGLGADTLTGGLGADTFRFDTAFSDANADLVVDFVHGVDKISILPTLVANTGGSGVLSASEFVATAGHNATDAHHILYDTSTGGLYYNADGAGAGDAVLIATLNGKPALSASDIVLSAGTPENDTMNGSASMNTAWYSGNMAGYSFAIVDGRLVVRDTNAADGQDGTDSLIQIESLQFANGQLNFTSSEFRVNTFTTNSQYSPSITALTDGGFVVSWESEGQDGSRSGIYAQRYDAAGQSAGAEFRVNSYTTGYQAYSTITALTDGGFVVSWESYDQVGLSYGIYAQRYDENGMAVGAELPVYTASIEDEEYLSTITALTDGGFVVSWYLADQNSSNCDVYAQRYNAASVAVGSEFRVNTYTTSDQYFPEITALADGGFVVSWTSNGQDGSGSGIYAQRYNAAGVAAGSEFRVNTYTTSSQSESAITALAAGGFVVSWNSSGQDGSGAGVYAQRYDAAGQTAGSEFQVNTYTTSSQFESSITALADGGFVVSWESYDQVGLSYGIYAKRYDAAGVAAGSEFRVNTYTTSDKYCPTITALADGGFVVSWYSYGQDGSGAGVYAQRYDANGEPFVPKFTGTAAADTINLDPGQLLTVDGAGGNDILNGSSGDDVLLGGTGNDKLTGNAGNDKLDGGAGADTMIGGLGDDTFTVDNVGDKLTEKAGAGNDSVFASVSWTLATNFENLILTGNGNINATGNTVGNLLTGNSGNNILDGKAGADILVGGNGNDTYLVDNLFDYISENADSGIDQVKTSVTFTLGDNIENLILNGSAAINGYGNNLENILTGNSGNNLLSGGGGGDTLSGLGGKDILDGGSGDDLLLGGLGNDTLTGGDGADTFRFDTAFSAGNVDLVMDFSTGVDTIAISQTLAKNAGGVGVLDAGEFIAMAGHLATDTHHMIYDTTSGGLYYNVDGAGKGVAVLISTFDGKPAIVNTDIVLA
jgi:large repetitive protein